MQVALVTVGDELLAGDTVNTNAAWLGRELRERGVDVERVTVVPDRVADVARVVNEYRADYDAVLVTGGLGPTHDDVTMEGVAAAVGSELGESREVLDWLATDGYARTDLAEGTADIPERAEMLENPEGVAPGCVVDDDVFVLPGIPTEMKAMFELVADRFHGAPNYVEVVEADEPESALVDRIASVRERFDVGVGSYPGDGVRLKVQGPDEADVERAAAWLRENVVSPVRESTE